MTKSYSELITFPTFQERFEYLKLDAFVGEETFGSDRYLNQMFYRTPEWKKFRRDMIIRDNGCDLGVDGYEIRGRLIIVHHINPICARDIIERNLSALLDPDNVICTCQSTHNAIHYGDEELVQNDPISRTPNDTCPWRN